LNKDYLLLGCFYVDVHNTMRYGRDVSRYDLTRVEQMRNSLIRCDEKRIDLLFINKNKVIN